MALSPLPALGAAIGLTLGMTLTGMSAASAASGSPRADLAQLFAPPTSAEIAAVRAEWDSRQITVDGYRLEANFNDAGGVRFDVFSHIVDGQRHYAAIRYPRNYVAGTPYSSIVACHGGLMGVSVEETANLLVSLPGLCVDDEFFLIIPSFRGEFLGTQTAGFYTSGGSPSWADRDVDDAMSALSAVLENVPDVDHARISAWGISRGAAVAMLMSARDDRIRRIVSLFGFTDMSLPSVQAELDLIVNQGAPPAGIGRVAYESFVLPWLSGSMSLADARQGWIRRSSCYFAADLPPIQVHHGLQDTQVDPSHAQVLLGAFSALGLGSPYVSGFFYPNGMHGINSLVGMGDRVEPFYCELQNGVRSYCGPMTPHFGGLYAAADYRGSCSIASNDFQFRVNNCRPNGVGLAFVSGQSGYTPAGAGFLCVGAGFARLGAGLIDSAGTFRLDVDIANPAPQVASMFAPGSAVYLQLVFRDGGSGPGFNFSNGLALTVEP